MGHIEVQYPLHLANKPSTNHHGNPVQFLHHQKNYKLEFLVDHTNLVHLNLDWFHFPLHFPFLILNQMKLKGGSKISEVSSQIVRKLSSKSELSELLGYTNSLVSRFDTMTVLVLSAMC